MGGGLEILKPLSCKKIEPIKSYFEVKGSIFGWNERNNWLTQCAQSLTFLISVNFFKFPNNICTT